jgi:hypothetical protein
MEKEPSGKNSLFATIKRFRFQNLAFPDIDQKAHCRFVITENKDSWAKLVHTLNYMCISYSAPDTGSLYSIKAGVCRSSFL